MDQPHRVAAVASGATWLGWLTWLGSHLAEINQGLQLVVLLLALITGVYALRAARKALGK